MSIKAMTRVWEHSRQKGSNLLALLALADHADDSGECWPSEERIAKKIRMSERQTQRILAGLEKKGEVARKLGDGRGNTTHYLILSGFNAEQKADKMASFLEQERVTDLTIKGDKSTRKRVTNPSSKKQPIIKMVTKQTTEIAGGEPSLEPSLEPSSIPPKAAKVDNSKSSLRAVPKRLSKDQCLKDALAIHWEGIAPNEATGYTGQLSARAGSVWRNRLGIDTLTAEQYQKIARSIAPFVSWMDESYPGRREKIESLDKFEKYYQEFASSDGKPKPKPIDNSLWGTTDSDDPATWLSFDDMVSAA